MMLQLPTNGQIDQTKKTDFFSNKSIKNFLTKHSVYYKFSFFSSDYATLDQFLNKKFVFCLEMNDFIRSNIIFMPMKKFRFAIPRPVFKHCYSMDNFEIRTFRRIIYIAEKKCNFYFFKSMILPVEISFDLFRIDAKKQTKTKLNLDS